MLRSGTKVTGVFQAVAVLACVLFALLMIVNNQGSGDAMWFWYAYAFRHGVRLYSEMHTALQPFFVMLMAGWTSLVGTRLVPYELPSLLNAFLLAFGLVLVLRESEWPDWQRAVLVFASFVLVVLGNSYRFDDYHVVDECLILYSFWLLLVVGRPDAVRSRRQEFLLLGALGVLCGLAFVTRVADGVALIVGAVISLAFLLPGRRKFVGITLFSAVAAVVALVVIKLTHESVASYATNSIFRAAGSKGGGNSLLASPFISFARGVGMFSGRKKIFGGYLLIFAIGWAVNRYWPRGLRYLFPLQIAVAVLVYPMLPASMKGWYREGMFYNVLILIAVTGMYFVAVFVLYRFFRAQRTGTPWDRREALMVVPMLVWASYAASAGGDPLMNYYSPVAFLLLLFPVLQPFRRQATWVNPSFATILALLAFWGVYTKWELPYSWQNYVYSPMFKDRVDYQHPIYGEMYIDRDLLKFSERVCRDIGVQPGEHGPELLSLPFPYPNYFCATPPWHNYVQTFFDTAQRSTIEHLTHELEIAPPHWIVYQRQINILVGAEKLYNHGQALPQRALDEMIMGRIRSGQWKLVDEVSYLNPTYWKNKKETDWYVIDTQSVVH